MFPSFRGVGSVTVACGQQDTRTHAHTHTHTRAHSLSRKHTPASLHEAPATATDSKHPRAVEARLNSIQMSLNHSHEALTNLTQRFTVRRRSSNVAAPRMPTASCSRLPHVRDLASISLPAPCTLHPAPCTLHPAPCTLAPCTLAPCTLAPCCT